MLVFRSFRVLLFVALIFSVGHFGYCQTNDLDKAKALDQQVTNLYRRGSIDAAIQKAQQGLDIREKALGPEHVDVAISLNFLANMYSELGEYDKAEPLYTRALSIREKALGPEHPKVATILNNFAMLYYDLAKYSTAEPLYERALAIREKTLGPEHVDVASSLNSLAENYRQLREYDKAEPLYTRALDIREKALGPEHPEVATSLSNLALLYCGLAEYSKAEPLYKRALAIAEKAFGSENIHEAIILQNLAELYYDSGQYAKAEPLYKRSLAIREKELGPGHVIVASSLNSLGFFYYSIGEYAKAEQLYTRALSIREKAFGSEHPGVATCLNNLAMLYLSLGEYAKAKPLFKRSLAIDEKVFGPEHPEVANNLNNLAGLYTLLGEYEKAEPLYKRALAINEKVFGPEHPKAANNLNNLAGLYHTLLGEYAKAEPLYKRALAINEKVFGPEHPKVAINLINLANLYAALDDFKKAYSLLLKVQHIDDKLIEQIMGFTNEEQKMKFVSMKKRTLYLIINLVVQHLSQDPSARKDALDVWLSRKGIVLEVQKRFQEALFNSDNPAALKSFQNLSKLRARLSKLAFSGPGKAGPDAYKSEITSLEAKKDILEVQLNKLSKTYALKRRVSKSDSLNVAKALPPNTVLLDFARIRMFNFKTKGKEKSWLNDHYLAFVVHPGMGNKPGMVDLGDAGEIDNAITLLKKEIVGYRDKKDPNMASASKKLYKLVFEPLLKELRNKREIFLSPDGNLNLIPFEVLQGPDGRFLIEDYTFDYLAAGRDIVGFGEFKKKGGKALLMGDPDFDLGEKEKYSSLRKLALRSVENTGEHLRSLDMRGLHFSRLPGTREEVITIHELFGNNNADVYTDKEALEEVLKQKGTPSILHLATHGFFLKDFELRDFSDDKFGRGLAVQFKKVSKKPSSGRIEIKNPLVRSGIALAGANNALKSNAIEKSVGIVTSEKILGLKLQGTDMVVLSACNTGEGEVKISEGVFGLRRAFAQAGARSLVMSMWSVPDRETKELMVNFYRNIITGEMTRSKALRQAVFEQMKIVKERYGHTNPFYWGAFVFMGEP